MAFDFKSSGEKMYWTLIDPSHLTSLVYDVSPTGSYTSVWHIAFGHGFSLYNELVKDAALFAGFH